jgi:hypothetical protein
MLDCIKKHQFIQYKLSAAKAIRTKQDSNSSANQVALALMKDQYAAAAKRQSVNKLTAKKKVAAKRARVIKGKPKTKGSTIGPPAKRKGARKTDAKKATKAKVPDKEGGAPMQE